MWDLSLLPHLCISSIICIYQHALMDIYFCTLGFNWMLLYFVIQSVSALAIGSFDIPPLVFFLFCFVFKALPYFLTSLILLTKCSRLILYISSPTPGISHFFKERWFFLVENILVLETKIWMLGVLTATGMLLLLSLLGWQIEETCGYSAYKHIYEYVTISIN